MSAPFPNLYTHRRVAESAAKACDVCYKSSSSVLVAPDNTDFFYICPIHLEDRYFCSPKVNQEADTDSREKKLDEEKEKVVKEYQERQGRKANREKGKDKEKGDSRKDEDGAQGKDAKNDEDSSLTAKEKGDKSAKQTQPRPQDDGSSPKDEPRVFELKSSFYQQRLHRKRQADAARRDRERTSQPGYFPSVPSEPPGR